MKSLSSRFSLFLATFVFGLGFTATAANAQIENLPAPPTPTNPNPLTIPIPTPAVPVAPTPTAVPVPTPTLVPPPLLPPTAQAYIASSPHPAMSYGRLMVPTTFFSNGMGASVGSVGQNHFRLLYFGTQIDFYPYQYGATINGRQVTLPARPLYIDGNLFVPMKAFSDALGLKWKRQTDKPHVFLVQYPAAVVQNVVSTVRGDRVRTVVTLSNATRVIASQGKLNAGFQFAGARQNGIPEFKRVNDYLVTHTTVRSANWNANLNVSMSYSAPIQWFTLGSPARIVVDVQRLFEERSTQMQAGIALTKIRRGTGHGPVQMWMARLDPRDGWRIRVQPGGYSVLQRARPSKLASRHRAVLAVNGGFFAYDGAAVGAVLVDKEWIRLPWQGRTAIGFDSLGRAHIANLQVDAAALFSSGARLPIRDLNGWPDKGKITALTRRFGTYYQLRAGEMAVVVKNGAVIARPGGGGASIPENGFTLVASGGARPFLTKIKLGERARLSIQPRGWPAITTALGGGPRLVTAGKIDVRDENFRSDVTAAPGPRTAFGVDKMGRYIIVVADGREKYYSTGLTLHELAATMQKLGAVSAMNLDGGGSTSMAVKGKVINKPSDGVERGVANALLVMR